MAGTRVNVAYLRGLFAIPPERQDVVTRGHVGNFERVNDVEMELVGSWVGGAQMERYEGFRHRIDLHKLVLHERTYIPCGSRAL